MTFEPVKSEEVETPQSWWMIMTHPAIIVSLLAVLSFIGLVTAKWQYMPPK